MLGEKEQKIKQNYHITNRINHGQLWNNINKLHIDKSKVHVEKERGGLR